MNSRILIAAVAASLLSLASADGQQRPAPPQRQRPPEGLACPANDLTAYTGVVVRLRREPGRTVLRIRTDWDTTEDVEVRHPGTDDPAAFFRYAGRPFSTKDWGLLESSPGVLRPATRATAWVCKDGTVRVDWGAPKEQ